MGAILALIGRLSEIKAEIHLATALGTFIRQPSPRFSSGFLLSVRQAETAIAHRAWSATSLIRSFTRTGLETAATQCDQRPSDLICKHLDFSTPLRRQTLQFLTGFRGLIQVSSIYGCWDASVNLFDIVWNCCCVSVPLFMHQQSSQISMQTGSF